MAELSCLQLGEEEDLGVCGIEASSRLDALLKRSFGCSLNAREEALIEAASGPGSVQAHVGQQGVGGFAQVIPGTVAYLPCPSPAMAMRLLELQHGCCPHHDQEHHHHRAHGCHCGTDPCSC